MRAAERAAVEEYLQSQALTLAPRHSLEDIVLLRVLSDHHQHAANLAKAGDAERAVAEMRKLDELARCDDPELALAYEVSAEPVWALVAWLDGRCVEAANGLLRALVACERLAVDHGHRYLSGKRIHLAANLSRLDATNGEPAKALAGVACLRAVMEGDRARWSFGAPDLLDVPLGSPARESIAHQLARIEAHATHAVEAR